MICDLGQDEYADESDPLPEDLIGNLKEFQISYTEVREGVGVVHGDGKNPAVFITTVIFQVNP